MTWTWGLCDLNGVPLGEVQNAYERRLTHRLNGDPSTSFRVRLDDPVAQIIAAQSVPDSDQWDCLVKVYQDSTLHFVGEVVSVDEGGAERGEAVSLTVVAGGPLEMRLADRLFQKSATPYEVSSVDAALLIVNAIDLANEERDTGIRTTGGTITSLYGTPYGPVQFKPVKELIEELQAAKVPYPIVSPPAYVGRDVFAQTGSPVLNGQTATTGGAWTTTGDANDFFVDTPTAVAARDAVSDSGATGGRWAQSGASDQTNVLVSVDWLSGGGDTYDLFPGVFARTNGTYSGGTAKWLLAYAVVQTNQIAVDKMVNGTQTTIATYTYPSGGYEPSVWLSLRLLVDDAGNYTVWQDAQGQLTAPKIVGRDTDLATGGALATGKAGFYDAYTGSAPLGRNYDNFGMSAYTGPQSFDFALNPVEPTIDGTEASTTLAPGANKVHCWTLDIVPQIGTTKEVVFEYGSGNRSAKGYTRAVARGGLRTRAYHLPQGFPTDTDVRVSLDATAIASRGLHEGVEPLDLTNSELRNAWVAANVAVRKQARQRITFEPSAQNPWTYGTDYVVGDTVTGRASVNGVERFNGQFRVYGVEITIDDEGKEAIVPTLTVE